MRKSLKSIDRPPDDVIRFGWRSKSEKKTVDDAMGYFDESLSKKDKIINICKRFLDVRECELNSKRILRKTMIENFKTQLEFIEDERQSRIIGMMEFLFFNDISEGTLSRFEEHYRRFLSYDREIRLREEANVVLENAIAGSG